VESYQQYLSEDSGDVEAELVVDRFAQRLRGLAEPWLVLFDNVDNPDDFKNVSPLKLQLGKGLGSFLVTTRSAPDRISIAHFHIEVGPMNEQESIELFAKCLDRNDHDPSELSALRDRLGGIPAALRLTARCLNKSRNKSVRHFIEVFDRYLASGPLGDVDVITTIMSQETIPGSYDDTSDEEQGADHVEIESVLSCVPSLTAGSTISSSLASGVVENIKSDVLTMLIKDRDIRWLFKETPKRITHDRFQRNFLRLFRSLLSDLRKQLGNRDQELPQVLRILKFQSRNIASHICQEIFDLKAQSAALSSLARQVPDKYGHLVSFFENDRYGH
jgi:hypothetical protein